jgi:hypothetical protein
VGSTVVLVQPESLEFYVNNIGDLPVSFVWKVPAPFIIEPGLCKNLLPGDSCTFTATFTASEAAVYTGAAICMLEGGTSTVTNLTAIGKFSFIRLEEDVIEHGSVLTGVTSTRKVQLVNKSLVPANFVISPVGKIDDALKLNPRAGCIKPGEHVELIAEYSPCTLGSLSAQEYHIMTPGVPVSILKQQGTAVGATVALSDRTLGFGDVALGHNSRKVHCQDSSCLVAQA